MSIWECLLVAILFLAGGGFWLGYVFLKGDERVKMSHRLDSKEDAALRQAVDEVRGELNELRQQVNALRDTATQYDMSFDTALRRLEQRISHIEKSPAEAQQTIRS